MEVSQPLGSLSGLPRELRDELYAYLVPAKIDLNPLLDGHQYLTSKLSNSLVSTLAILRLSRTIHEEATTVLYCRGTFRLLLPYHRIRDFRVPSITDRIMNVEFSYRMLVQDIHTIEVARDFDAATYSSLTAPVTLFGGNSIQRKSALIEIWISEWSSYTTNTIFSPFFEALKQLTGFRKVTLKLKAPRRPIYDAQRSCQVLEFALTRFNSALEPTLGTGVMSELDPSLDPLKDVPLSRQIVFHQEYHVAEISKIRGDISSDKAEYSMRGEADQSTGVVTVLLEHKMPEATRCNSLRADHLLSKESAGQCGTKACLH